MRPEDVPQEWMDAADQAMKKLVCPRDLRAALAAVAPLIAAAEREACAQEADYYTKHSTTAKNIAAAIRARGEVK